jgi:hypothetical protein
MRNTDLNALYADIFLKEGICVKVIISVLWKSALNTGAIDTAYIFRFFGMVCEQHTNKIIPTLGYSLSFVSYTDVRPLPAVLTYDIA